MGVKRKLRKLINDPKMFIYDSKLVKAVNRNQERPTKSGVKVVQLSKPDNKKQNLHVSSTKFRNVTEDSSVLSMGYVEEAQKKIAQSQFDEAIRLSDTAIAICPTNAFAYLVASKARATLEEKDLVYSYAEEAYRLYPESLLVQGNLAKVSRDHGVYNDFVESLYDNLLRVSYHESAISDYVNYIWEAKPASVEVSNKVVKFVNANVQSPQVLAVVGAYIFDAGMKKESLYIARKLIDLKEGKRFKKYSLWFKYISNYYDVVKNNNDQNVLKLGNDFFDGQEKLVNRIRKSKRVVIVGNSPREKGMKNGRDIDSADLVIRFNNYPDSKDFSKDYGKKTNVWVRSIGSWVEDRDVSEFDHVVVSGTNLLGRGFNIKNFKDFISSETEVSVFNRDFHYQLINILEGVPSAGLMMLYMVYKLRGELRSKDVFGFGFVDQLQEGVVNVGNSPAGVRHHWDKELSLYHAMLEGGVK